MIRGPFCTHQYDPTNYEINVGGLSLLIWATKSGAAKFRKDKIDLDYSFNLSELKELRKDIKEILEALCTEGVGVDDD